MPPTGWSTHPNSETIPPVEDAAADGGRIPDPSLPTRFARRLPGLPCTSASGGTLSARRNQGVLTWPIAARSSTTTRTWRSSSPTGRKITKDVDIKVFTEAVRRSDADTIRDLQGLRHRRDDARAHPLSARGDRRPAEAQAPHHHRRLQRLDRHEGLPGARHRGLRHRRLRQSDHRHHLRPDPRTDPPDRLGARAHEIRRALADHARHGHRGQDARRARSRQARRARRRRRQGVRHEGDRLEPESDARAMQGGRRRVCRPRTICSATPTS